VRNQADPQAAHILREGSQPQGRAVSAFGSINKCEQVGLAGLQRLMAAANQSGAEAKKEMVLLCKDT